MNHPLFHRILSRIRGYETQPRGFLVGLSGGADSVALLSLLSEVSKVLGVEIKAVHCHHGLHPDDSSGQSQFRDESLRFCEQVCERLRVEFVCNVSPVEKGPVRRTQSEAELRRVRYQFFGEVYQKLKPGWGLALGHHREDLLETQFLSLIRGAGPLALSRLSGEIRNGNQYFRGSVYRPLLCESKSTLIEFLDHVGLAFVEDPSNLSHEPLRNWLRSEWLPGLEKKREGSLQALARSFDLLGQWVSDTCHQIPFEILGSEGIQRESFQALSARVRSHIFMHFLQENQVFHFKQTQLEEALKRLDSPQKNHTFTLAGCHFQVCKHWIKVTAPVVPYE